MRNLKRALSLALASVMLLGMMVVGTSAASFPDVDEKDNVEAIEVLNAVKVMIGRQGNFEPTESVNRHEMAVIMAKLVLGVDTADSYVGSHPFTDVVPWADQYVAACYENGLIAGKSATTYNGSDPLTAVEAAAMMLRALGYKDLNKGYQGDWRAPITATANQIRLFNGVASNPSEKLNRNQVAQLTLNTLKSPVVDLKDGTFNIADGNGQIIVTGGNREYIVRSSSEAYAKAINSTEVAGTSASMIGGCTVELGEHLYNGKLRLEDTTDDFGRPARYWEYDGSGIGTYMKTELIRKEYVGKVTSKDLYTLLGASALRNNELAVYVDGVTAAKVNGIDTGVFDITELTRAGTTAVGRTGTGVLTQVFVDSNEELITVAVINTYLAKANADYNDKKESLSLTAYGVKVDTKKNVVKQDDDDIITAYSEDCALAESAKADDFFLVTLANGAVQSFVKAPTVDNVTLNSFKRDSWVNAQGTKYDYADTVNYDPDVLNQYDDSNMKNTTYKLYLDQYNNMIGIEIVDDELNYVFITGVEAFGSKLGSSANAEAFGIFTDGTSKTITVKDAGKVKTAGNNSWSSYADDGQEGINQWYTYTTDKSGNYTLGRIPYSITEPGFGRVAQGFDITTGAINKSHPSLKGESGLGERAYGNNESIYLLAETELYSENTTMGTKNYIISGVSSVATGVDNVDIDVATGAEAAGTHNAIGVNFLHDKKGYVIAAVVLGEDNGNAKDYAFILDSEPTQEDYNADPDEWVWYRKAIVNGQEVELKEKGSSAKYLGKAVMGQYEWYRISEDKDGYVVNASSKNKDDTNYVKNQAVDFTGNTVGHLYISSPYAFTQLAQNDGVALVREQWTGTETDAAKRGLVLQEYTLYTYDRNDYNTGIHLKSDANAVLIQEDVDDSRVIEYFDSKDGRANVEQALKTLENNYFKGEVYYVMDDGEASTIIIVDKDSHDSDGIQGPNNKKVAKVEYFADMKVLYAEDKDGTRIDGATISLYMMDKGWQHVGDYTTSSNTPGHSGITESLDLTPGQYKAVCGSVEKLFTVS